MKRTVPLALAALFVTASVARADIAPPRPEDMSCPRGAVAQLPPVPAGATDERGRPLRAWPYCAPSTCTADSDCDGGRVCSTEEIGLCVEDHQVPGGSTVRQARERGCEPNNTCLNLQATCERARRCVAPPEGAAPPAPEAPAPEASAGNPPPDETEAPATEDDAPPATTASTCACHAASPATPSWLAFLAVLPIALLFRRRRRC